MESSLGTGTCVRRKVTHFDKLSINRGRSIAQAAIRQLHTAATLAPSQVWYAGFVADKVARVQVFSEDFRFSCQFSFHRILHNHHHLSSGAGTIGQIVADVPSGLRLTPHQETKIINGIFMWLA
jgi:hypothetical protein